MGQIIPQTHDEKVKMYSKLKKKELIEMLIAANENNLRGTLITQNLCPTDGEYKPSTVTYFNPDTPFHLTASNGWW
jgi:hypothetical protein